LGIGEGAPEIATASRDGSVKIWDPRQNETPVAVIEPAENETKRDAWTVCFGIKNTKKNLFLKKFKFHL
jgi:WD repeat-containing protein 92